jgi:hypothetical protein
MAVVGIALAGRPQPDIDHGGQGVGHGGQHLPDLVVERVPGRLALERGCQPQLEHESVVLGGQLPVEAVGEGLAGQLAAEPAGSRPPPGLTLGEPGKCAGGGELPGLLGQDVVVGRRPLAGQGGQPLLVVVQLLEEHPVAFEQRPGPGPAVQQPADPHPRQQPHPELDAAGPVDAGQERVGRPPGTQLGGGGLGVALVAAEPVGGRQHRQVLVTRRLPDILDVADHGRVAVVDVEAVGPVGGAPAGARVEEPVRGRGHVVALVGEHRPAPGQQPLGGLLEPDAGVLGHLAGAWVGDGEGRAGGRHRGRVGGGL